MKACLINLLLNAYLNEQSKVTDISGIKLPKLSQSDSALLTLENIYIHIQQTLASNKKTEQTEQKANDNDDTPLPETENNESSQIVITVCDETKNIKPQFTCNRLLLIREMRYFADYLKEEPDQAEEVDISVHCDSDIFRWLMLFVNRRSKGEVPEIQTRDAISILISSDFLKMDKLVNLALDYVHDHLSEIIVASCTVSCMSDKLFRQLTKRFENPYEIELLQDKKNKIRNKLFEYSLEGLLTNTKIVRCQYCLLIMAINQMDNIPCLIDRTILASNGKMFFQHKIDLKFDINAWVREIHSRTENSWRNTFWIVWLHVQVDQCVRCGAYFRFIDYSTCSYHPILTITDGKHDCCSQFVETFNVLQFNNRNNGCQQREHLCKRQSYLSEIYENLDKVELTKNHPSIRMISLNINFTNAVSNKLIEQSLCGSLNSDNKKSPVNLRWIPLLDTDRCGADVKYVWDSTKSTRWNQDAQREDEQRRFYEMSRYMHSIQPSNKLNTNRSLKESNITMSISPGGMYCQIENEWRTRQNSSSSNNSNTNKNRQRQTQK